jgi:hypothetical protein
MTSIRAEQLRKSIENLLNVKLHDALAPGGLDRLKAHRLSGVVSPTIRAAQRDLENALADVLDLVHAGVDAEEANA